MSQQIRKRGGARGFMMPLLALSPRWLFHNGRYYVQLPNGLFVIQILIVFGCPHETGGRLSRDEQNGQRIAGLGSTKHTPDYGI